MSPEMRAKLEEKSILQDYQFTLRLQVEGSGEVQLSLDQGATQQKLDGTWSLISGDESKIVVQISPSGKTSKGESRRPRRFVCQFFDDGDKFLLSQENADQRLGSLVFTRTD